jgi:hypothetical protein
MIAASTPETCAFDLTGIDRTGPAIHIRYDRRGGCLLTPGWFSARTPLGLLSPGNYMVTVAIGDKAIDSREFFVADGAAPLKVLPSSRHANAFVPVQISMNKPLCVDRFPCDKPIVMFGDVAVPDQLIFVVDPQTIRVTPPPHEPGFVDVVVRTPAETIIGKSSFRFTRQEAVPDPQIFERILLPIVYNGSGAYSTGWRTDLAILNTNPVGVSSTDAFRPLFFHPCFDGVCPGGLGPNEQAEAFDATTKSDRGLLLMPQRDLADGLRFSYRAWEMIQFAERRFAGTELPIVRERDFRIGRLDLPSISLDHNSRIALRIFGPDSEAVPVRVIVGKLDNLATLIGIKEIVLQAPACETDPCDSLTPSFAMISDLEQEFPALRQLERVRLEVESPSGRRFWAMATITNNTTQNVTVVTPQ